PGGVAVMRRRLSPADARRETPRRKTEQVVQLVAMERSERPVRGHARQDALMEVLRAPAQRRGGPGGRRVRAEPHHEYARSASRRSSASTHSRSSRSGYEIPDAPISFGYTLVGVNPGIVLSSLTSTFSPSTKKS